MKKYECVQNMWKLEINSVPKAVRQVTLVMGILCSIQFYRSWKPSKHIQIIQDVGSRKHLSEKWFQW